MDNASTLADDEEGAEELLQAHTAAQSEAFDAEMKDRLKSKGDRFEEMVEHEEGIRLGDEGWKERYYKVQPLSGRPPHMTPSHLHGSCCLVAPVGVQNMGKLSAVRDKPHTYPSFWRKSYKGCELLLPAWPCKISTGVNHPQKQV